MSVGLQPIVILRPSILVSRLSGGGGEQERDGKGPEGWYFARIYFVGNAKGNTTARREVEAETEVTSAKRNHSCCYFKRGICFILIILH